MSSIIYHKCQQTPRADSVPMVTLWPGLHLTIDSHWKNYLYNLTNKVFPKNAFKFLQYVCIYFQIHWQTDSILMQSKTTMKVIFFRVKLLFLKRNVPFFTFPLLYYLLWAFNKCRNDLASWFQDGLCVKVLCTGFCNTLYHCAHPPIYTVHNTHTKSQDDDTHKH